MKHKDGRRNRYQIQSHLPLPDPGRQDLAIGEVLALLTGADARQRSAMQGTSLKGPQVNGAHAPKK